VIEPTIRSAVGLFELRTLGEFAISHAGVPLPAPTTKKARALLVYLVMNRRADVSREALLERFWPEFEPERARDNLKVSLWSVRRAIRAANVNPDEVIRGDRTILRWIAPVDLDVERFSALCAESPSSATHTDALALYRGDFLEGDFDEWVAAQRERLGAAYETMLSRAAAASRDVVTSETLLGRNPYDESAYSTLIDAELRAGRPQAAAVLAERCRAALADVGAEPSEEFERRFGSLRRAETSGDEFRLPFVSRDAELGELGRRVTEAETGAGSVSLVHGDAGIGKSSVLAQVAHASARAGLRTVELRCTGRETQTLGEWQPTYERTTGRSFSDIVGTAGSGARAALASDLCDAFAARPTVFIIDDVQYLSGESFAALVDVVQRAAETTCVIIASRPEGVARIRSSLSVGHDLHEVRLDCLSATDLESAVRQGAGSDLSTLARAVFERTKGHPLYVVQTLAALVENGALARGDRRWTLRSRLEESLPVSATMRAFIEGRLTARGSVPAAVASALALEPAASASELGSALGMDETTLLDALDDLLSLGLILQPESGTPFAFSHDLVQEAAAAMLNAGRRVRLHAAFARELRQSTDRDAAIRRARHLLAAGEPLAASQDFLTAARRARDAGLANDTIARASEGIAALERLDDSLERERRLSSLNREIAIARYALQDFDSASASVEAAVACARAAADADELTEALLLRARLAEFTHAPLERVPIAREALESARPAGDPELVARALTEVAAAARECGEHDAAMNAAVEAFETATRAERWDTAQRAGAELILTCATWWNFSEALRWLLRIDEAVSHAGSPAQAAHRNARAVLWHLLERDAEAAADLALAARSLDAMSPSRASGDSLAAARAFNGYFTAELACANGDGAVALDALDKAQLPGVSERPARATALELVRIEGFLLRDAAGDAQRAREMCARLPQQTHRQSVFGLSACVELTRARVEAVNREPAAERALRRALDVVEDHAHRTPLSADAAFDRLAAAARAFGSGAIAVRAAERAAFFRSERRAAAGSAWGGRA
jgi:DNA-binding SARP family transcriptional activator